MASLDKKSVREEFEKIKVQFDLLCHQEKVSTEVKLLMQSMLSMMTLVLAIFMERQTKKSAKNSSLPPSQSPPDNTASKNNHNKESGAKGKVTNTRTTEKTGISKVNRCQGCHQSLANVEVMDYERRTKIDIIFEKVIEHTDAEIKVCPACQTKSKGVFPKDLHGPLQYGNGLKAFAIHLIISQMVSLNRAQKLIHSMMGEKLSEATLLKSVLRLHQALEGWEKEARLSLLQQPVIHVDETGFRVEKDNYWIHTHSSGDIVLKYLHRRRGKEAINEIDIIPAFDGILVHDGWLAYFSYQNCGHALCGAHLLRELTFIVDAHQYKWAKNIKRLLLETCHLINDSETKCLSTKAYANLQKRYRNLLTRGEKELPEIPPRPSGKRGRLAKSDAHNLWARFKTYETEILLFAKEAMVPFTNNRAERDLRMAKVKQKVSGCFRAKEYGQAYCRISSYLQTMANKGYNPLVAIQMALVEEGGE